MFPGCFVQWIILQDVLWGLVSCFTWAVGCVPQAKAVQMGVQMAVPNMKVEDSGLLVV